MSTDVRALREQIATAHDITEQAAADGIAVYAQHLLDLGESVWEDEGQTLTDDAAVVIVEVFAAQESAQ